VTHKVSAKKGGGGGGGGGWGAGVCGGSWWGVVVDFTSVSLVTVSPRRLSFFKLGRGAKPKKNASRHAQLQQSAYLLKK